VLGNADRGGNELGTPFFLSYGRTREDIPQVAEEYSPDQQVHQFFNDLTVNISQLITLPIGMRHGFMDRTMRGGVNWSGELLHALGTCQILVALLSPKYLSSEWCRKEWNAFEQRNIRALGQGVSPRQGCIIPVKWVPYPENLLPPRISADMIFSPDDQPQRDVPDLYRQHGVFGLKRMGQNTSYGIIVWQLAMDISRVYYGQYVAFKEFKPEDLRDIFGGGGGD